MKFQSIFHVCKNNKIIRKITHFRHVSLLFRTISNIFKTYNIVETIKLKFIYCSTQPTQRTNLTKRMFFFWLFFTNVTYSPRIFIFSPCIKLIRFLYFNRNTSNHFFWNRNLNLFWNRDHSQCLYFTKMESNNAV